MDIWVVSRFGLLIMLLWTFLWLGVWLQFPLVLHLLTLFQPHKGPYHSLNNYYLCSCLFYLSIYVSICHHLSIFHLSVVDTQHSNSIAYFILATVESLPFLKHSRYMPTSRSLAFLLECSSSRYSHDLLHHFS